MKSRFFTLSLSMLLLTTIVAAKANPIDMELACEIGTKFLNAKRASVNKVSDSDLQWVTTYQTHNGIAAFYVFNSSSDGFVIVAADDCAHPILGYSTKGLFDTNNVPVQLQEYLKNFVEQIEYGIEHHLTADSSIAYQWQLVQTTGRLNNNKSNKEVFPLLTTTWNQGCLYNALCPEDPEGQCGHVWAGCAPTAMAQVMHYWGYPIKGCGSNSYTPSGYPEQTAHFGATTYDWNNMPNALDWSSDSTQINAIATLIWHCGVSLNTGYGVDGSGAAITAFAFYNYFGYSEEIFHKDRFEYDDTTWMTMLKNSLDLGYPLCYTGCGAPGPAHVFVCDGYDDSDNLHFNWGWGGYCDGYFALDALDVGGYSFSAYNSAYFNIHPACTTGTEFNIQASANTNEGGMVSGTGTYECSAECNLSAIPNDGYRFISWTENNSVVSTNTSYVFPATEDRNLVAVFEDLSNGIHIGEGSSVHWNLPFCSCNEYSLTEQIYTSSDIGAFCGNITSIAFFNNTLLDETRNLTVYLVKTNKSGFNSPTDWIVPTDDDQYFSGNVTFRGGDWTTIYFEKPLYYDGTFHLAVMVDDNTGISAEQIEFLYYYSDFDFDKIRALKAWESGINYDPFSPEIYESYHDYTLNQIILGINGHNDTETITIIPLTIYPNPTKNELCIEGADIRQVEVFNTMGQLIETIESYGAETLHLDVESYRPSVYILKIQSGNGIVTKRFVKGL